MQGTDTVIRYATRAPGAVNMIGELRFRVRAPMLEEHYELRHQIRVCVQVNFFLHMRELVQFRRARPLSGLGELLNWVFGAATDDLFKEFCKWLPARDFESRFSPYDYDFNFGGSDIDDRIPIHGSAEPCSGGGGGGGGGPSIPCFAPSASEAIVRLVSATESDGEVFLVPMAAARMSEFVTTMMIDAGVWRRRQC